MPGSARGSDSESECLIHSRSRYSSTPANNRTRDRLRIQFAHTPTKDCNQASRGGETNHPR